MLLALETSALAAIGTLEAVKTALEPAIDAGVGAVGAVGLKFSEGAMERLIYDQPLPESMARRGQVRTYALLGAETLLGGDTLMSGNDVLAAGKHYQMITTSTDFIGPYGHKRPLEYARWRHNYIKLFAPWRLRAYQELVPVAPTVFDQAASAVIAVTGAFR